ncbi:hypothetical protein Tco_0004811 [Tanacetum coccineum]
MPSSLKKSATSSRKETRLYTKPGNGIMTYYINAPLMTLIAIRRTSSRNTKGSSNSEGIAAIVNKLENLGRDIKKLKENVHAIQVGCQICKGAYLDKDCPLNKEVKSLEEVKYGEYNQPYPNNNINDGRFNREGYYQLSSGERRPSLTEIINKYMEESSKRHAEQDKWLKKFYQSIQISREAHDKIIQGLETKVKTLANEVEGRVNNGKFEECKTICIEDRSPLYTPFYYSPEEIEYFSSNSGFSDNEKQETDNSGMEKENGSEYWQSCNPNHDVCDEGDSSINKMKRYWESMNDNKREEIRDEEYDIEENLEDLEECGDDKENAIIGADEIK